MPSHFLSPHCVHVALHPSRRLVLASALLVIPWGWRENGTRGDTRAHKLQSRALPSRSKNTRKHWWGGGHKRSKVSAPPDDDEAGNMSSQGRLYLATRAWMEPTSTSLREQPVGSPMPCIASRSTHNGHKDA